MIKNKIKSQASSTKEPEWNKIISSELFQQLYKLNLIDETELRNLKIRYDYKILREQLTASHCLEILMFKYSLSDASIHSILFRKSRLKQRSSSALLNFLISSK